MTLYYNHVLDYFQEYPMPEGPDWRVATEEDVQREANKVLFTTVQQAIQLHLDNVAKTRGYDGILSLCSYAASLNPKFSGEAQAGVVWRDECWAYAYNLFDMVQAGEIPVPSIEDVLEGLPQIVWPS